MRDLEKVRKFAFEENKRLFTKKWAVGFVYEELECAHRFVDVKVEACSSEDAIYEAYLKIFETDGITPNYVSSISELDDVY